MARDKLYVLGRASAAQDTLCQQLGQSRHKDAACKDVLLTENKAAYRRSSAVSLREWDSRIRADDFSKKNVHRRGSDVWNIITVFFTAVIPVKSYIKKLFHYYS